MLIMEKTYLQLQLTLIEDQFSYQKYKLLEWLGIGNVQKFINFDKTKKRISNFVVFFINYVHILYYIVIISLWLVYDNNNLYSVYLCERKKMILC